MASFKDSKGREWDVDISVGTAMRLKKEGVNFYGLAENHHQKFLAMHDDHEAFALLLWAIIKPQAEAKQVSADDLFESLGGESLQAAWEAVAFSYANFIPNPEIRSSLTRTFEKSRSLQQKAAKIIEDRFTRAEEIAETKLAQLAAQMDDNAITALIDESLKNSVPQKSSEPSSVSLAT